MYNLIVSGNDESWNGDRFRIELGRYGEHTDPTLFEQYKELNETTIGKVQSFPTIFAFEHGYKRDARVGYIKQVIVRSGQIGIDYEFYPNLPPIPSAELSRISWELDIGKYEMTRTHWAIKDVDLFVSLEEMGLATAEQLSHIPGVFVKSNLQETVNQMIVTPKVFAISNQSIEPDLVSVMMPFSAAFSNVFASIEQACSNAGLRCLRVDGIWEDSSVIQDIFNLLYRSKIVVVDFTERNPNVMYETGIAHTLGREVVPITQNINDVPFDLRHHRALTYLPNTQGLEEMKADLTRRLITLNRR